MLTGLVVGKFCPLHKGHEALIAFARARCDRLIILSYTKPDYPGCPTSRRVAWLEALFPFATRLVLDDRALASFAARSGQAPRLLPANEAADEVHRAFVAWACRTIAGSTVERVFTSEDYGDGFAASLAGHFGHAVEHVAFDPGRRIVPVSGMRLRERPSMHRAFLSEPVRRTLVRRVALLGGESTGKSTLAAALANRLGTQWVSEYGRDLWERRGGRLYFEDLLAIGREQVAREEAAVGEADGWLICDTSPLATMFYSESMFDRVDPRLAELAHRKYDRTFLCAPDFPFVQDGTRRDDAFRMAQDSWYRHRLAVLGVPFQVLNGALPARLEAAVDRLT